MNLGGGVKYIFSFLMLLLLSFLNQASKKIIFSRDAILFLLECIYRYILYFYTFDRFYFLLSLFSFFLYNRLHKNNAKNKLSLINIELHKKKTKRRDNEKNECLNTNGVFIFMFVLLLCSKQNYNIFASSDQSRKVVCVLLFVCSNLSFYSNSSNRKAI